MSKVMQASDASEFLRNLRENSKFTTKLLENPQTAVLQAKKAKTTEAHQSRKKTTNHRHSNIQDVHSEPQSSTPLSQNIAHLPMKVRSNVKTAQIALYHFGVLNYSVGDPKKKMSTSNSNVEFENDQNSQHTPKQNKINGAGINAKRNISQEQSNNKPGSRGQYPHSNDFTGLKNYSASPNFQAYQSGVKSHSKSRINTGSGSKDRTLSETKVVKNDNTLPQISTNYTHRRGVSPAQAFENKSYHTPVKHIQHIHLTTSEGDKQENSEYKEPSKNYPLGHVKSSHPLKEIKIDICNIAEQNPEVQKSSSTSRTKIQAPLFSQRPEKESQEKPVKPTRGVTTPQERIVSRSNKQRFIVNSTPKQEAIPQKEAPKKAQFKNILTDDENKHYGNRFLEDYEKLDFLGRGGFALVWLGVEKKSGRKVAVKQMLKGSGSEAQKKELTYGRYLFGKDGEPQEEFRRYPGIQWIASFIDYRSTKLDDWHVTELGGKTLSKLVFDIKGEFFKGERIYRVKNGELSNAFRADNYSLRFFIKQMAQVLHLLSDQKIVHCDLKPDNILINLDNYRQGKPFDLKVIDFGSAYTWDDLGNIGMATPEYMPPEFLHVLTSHKSNKSSVEILTETTNPWSIDVWSLGAIVLEIITGVPLWMSLKCRVDIGQKSVFRMGLFAVKSRAYDKIYLRQKSVMEDFGGILSEYAEMWREHEHLFDLLYRMMEWSPLKRISPQEILGHPYLKGV